MRNGGDTTQMEEGIEEEDKSLHKIYISGFFTLQCKHQDTIDGDEMRTKYYTLA